MNWRQYSSYDVCSHQSVLWKMIRYCKSFFASKHCTEWLLNMVVCAAKGCLNKQGNQRELSFHRLVNVVYYLFSCVYGNRMHERIVTGLETTDASQTCHLLFSLKSCSLIKDWNCFYVHCDNFICIWLVVILFKLTDLWVRFYCTGHTMACAPIGMMG